jgi:pyruvate,water dikinase
VAAAPAARLPAVLAEHAEGAPVLASLERYLETYGHQIYNLDFAAPTQADAPLPVLLNLKSALAHPERSALTQQARLAGERELLVQHTSEVLSPLSRPFFRLFLSWAQRTTPYREEALFYVGAAWPTLRRLALELGRRLVESSALAVPDHVFFLYTAELREASAVPRPDLAQRARERHDLREARKRLTPPLVIPPGAQLKFGPFRLALFEPQPPTAATGATLAGFAVSPGQVTAPASVIRSPADFDQMAPDTILVCPTTTPAWTPLFAQARGLVTDIGGTLAHGSIVAREYGIPAVMGTGVATQRIQPGQLILVDGDHGTVTLLDEAGAVPDMSPTPEEASPAARRRLLALLALAAALVLALLVWRRRRGRSA